MKGNIFLIGFMGTGKTTVSRELSQMTGVKEADLDQEIEKRCQMKISEIFSSFGELYFRELETALIKEYEKKQGYVVSCGGGAVLRKENVQSMKKGGRIVLLSASAETVYERVRYSKSRPLLEGNMNVDYIFGLMEQRREAYTAAADLTVGTDGRTPKEIAEDIIKMVKL